jgi:hypothetical protein
MRLSVNLYRNHRKRPTDASVSGCDHHPPTRIHASLHLRQHVPSAHLAKTRCGNQLPSERLSFQREG